MNNNANPIDSKKFFNSKAQHYSTTTVFNMCLVNPEVLSPAPTSREHIFPWELSTRIVSQKENEEKCEEEQEHGQGTVNRFNKLLSTILWRASQEWPNVILLFQHAMLADLREFCAPIPLTGQPCQLPLPLKA
jgi:hypothetical protein